MQGLGLTRTDKPGYFAVRVILAAKEAGPQHARLDAGRFTTSQNIIQTKPAFVYHPPLFIEGAGLVGTGHFAVLATYTSLLVD